MGRILKHFCEYKLNFGKFFFLVQVVSALCPTPLDSERLALLQQEGKGAEIGTQSFDFTHGGATIPLRICFLPPPPRFVYLLLALLVTARSTHGFETWEVSSAASLILRIQLCLLTYFQATMRARTIFFLRKQVRNLKLSEADSTTQCYTLHAFLCSCPIRAHAQAWLSL